MTPFRFLAWLHRLTTPGPIWTEADERALINDRRLHRPVRRQLERKRAAIHAELKRCTGWRSGWRAAR